MTPEEVCFEEKRLEKKVRRGQGGALLLF